MINTQDQEELFKLIAEYLSADIRCLAIGGTAMMFSGYKNATKDIDLVFESEKARLTFIKAIEQLGYKEKSLIEAYDDKRRRHKGKPTMFSRGDERFDLFVKNVFGFELDVKNTAFTQRHDFIGKRELIIKVLPKEYLLLLKAITGREKDEEDMETIISIGKDIDWQLIVDEAIKQKSKNGWLLLDLEETMQRLRKKAFIKKQYFDAIYKAQKEIAKKKH
ncbi:nucleotidyltransferase [Candidatus Woesearchaeota archaeon]|nr:nucleotidyltransferase [Candidatus Woesearchaeota archaeon]